MSNLFWIVCIVAIVVAAETWNKYMKMKQKEKEHDPELEDSLAKIDMLEERIRVLERIVTENKHDLGREIDNLR
jgi:high-affinity nickel permease